MKTIEEAIQDLGLNINYEEDNYDAGVADGFEKGAKWVLDNQWHKIERNKYGYITPKCLKKMYANDTIVIYNTKYKSKNIIDSDFLKWRCSNIMFTDYDYWMPIKFKCDIL